MRGSLPARRKAWGAVSLKQYLQPTRYQRQWVAEAGRQLGLMVTAASLFFMLADQVLGTLVKFLLELGK